MKLEKLISDHSTLAQIRANELSGGFTHRLVVKYTDLNTGGAVGDFIAGDGSTSNGKTIYPPIYTTTGGTGRITLEPFSVLEKVALKVVTAFAGSSISALTADMGIDGNTDALLDAVNLRVLSNAISGVSGDGAAANQITAQAALNVPLRITTAGAATTALTAGEFHLFLKVYTLPTESGDEIYSI